VPELLFTIDGLLDGERKVVSFDSTVPSRRQVGWRRGNREA
jgi:hypothetical protein